MAIILFEPDKLRTNLASLDSRCRVAFAVACSLRAAATGESPEALAEAARRLAEHHAYNESINLLSAKQLLWELDQSAELDRDDVAASFYALSAAVNEDSEAALWAAQRAYDARDARAQASMRISSYSAHDMSRILRHPEVQAELEHQALDLKELQLGVKTIPSVIERARSAA